MSSNKSKKLQPYGWILLLKLGQISGFDKNLKPAARRILSILIGYSDQTGMCHPSISRLAQKLGVTRTAIINQIRILEKHGYLKSISRSHSNSGATLSNVYEFNLDLARQFCKEPHLISERTAAASIPTPVTSGDYPLGNEQMLQSPVISVSDTKKPIPKDTIDKKPFSLSKKQSRALQKANIWQASKALEDATGITRQMQEEMDSLQKELYGKLPINQRVQLDIDLRKRAQSTGGTPSEIYNELKGLLIEQLERVV